MKRYILFSDKDMDDLLCGREVELRVSSGETLYFMTNEAFAELADANDVDEDEDEYEDPYEEVEADVEARLCCAHIW